MAVVKEVAFSVSSLVTDLRYKEEMGTFIKKVEATLIKDIQKQILRGFQSGIVSSMQLFEVSCSIPDVKCL